MPYSRRLLYAVVCAVFFVFLVLQQLSSFRSTKNASLKPANNLGPFKWKELLQHFPVTSLVPLPTGVPAIIPKIQHQPQQESSEAKAIREARLKAVKGNFSHAWDGYRTSAWLRDELRPLSGGYSDHFGGWAATLVDSLDTLWIMGLKKEFEEAVAAVSRIDFTSCKTLEINVFETTIRFLGGLLAAYDVSQGKYPVLLSKAEELGQMLYHAFDTPNRMPITRWKWPEARDGSVQEADSALIAEIGSLSLEFTRLSQLTNDDKYYDAVQRITNEFHAQQNSTLIPGLWPIVVDTKHKDFTGGDFFSIGAMADSLYEYLPKQHLLLGGLVGEYREMYERAIVPIKKHIVFRPMTRNREDIMYPGVIKVDEYVSHNFLTTETGTQHLSCFAGGMVALGAKLFNAPEDLVLARQLTDGCIRAYLAMPHGIMPEILHFAGCPTKDRCEWNETIYETELNNLSQQQPLELERPSEYNKLLGVTNVDDPRYILRPEAIESAFILYRVTGDPKLPDQAWQMFEAIIKATETEKAHAALSDCISREPMRVDYMESFWTAETLKYFYLMFSDFGLIDLDEYVFNTEAHPLKRPVQRHE